MKLSFNIALAMPNVLLLQIVDIIENKKVLP